MVVGVKVKVVGEEDRRANTIVIGGHGGQPSGSGRGWQVSVWTEVSADRNRQRSHRCQSSKKGLSFATHISHNCRP